MIPASWSPLSAGAHFTQPRDYSLADPWIVLIILDILHIFIRGYIMLHLLFKGSSAGAGSGEFHVYRQIRRKEMFRTRILDREREKEELDDAFQVRCST